MRPALIENATHNPGCPEGVDGGRLPIRVVADPSGNIMCESAWRPTANELDVLVSGGYVKLVVCGWQVPVVLTVMGKDGAMELL